MNYLNNPPQLTLKCEQPGSDIRAAQLTATSQAVTVAYFNAVGNVVYAFEMKVKDNPELSNICQFSYFGDVWDMELVAALVDQYEPDEPAPGLAPLIPAYLESLGVQ